MSGFTRRSKPLKAGTAIAEVDGVSLTGLADDDLLVYDATSEAFLNSKTLGGSYVISGGLTTATLATSGNATLGGAMSVAGNTSLTGTLSVAGSTSLAALSATTLTLSGAASLASTLDVAGALSAQGADFSQPVSMNLGLTVFGATTLAAVAASSLALSSTLDVTGMVVLGSNVGIGGDLSVIGTIATGSSFSASSLGASGTLSVGGATTLFSTLSVSGAATLASTLNVTGTVTGTIATFTTSGAFGTTAGAYTITDGWGISGTLSNAVSGNQDAKLSFRNGGRSTQVGVIGFETGLHMYVRNQAHGGNIILSAEDGSGNVEQGFAYVPDSSAFLYYAGATKAYTIVDGWGLTGTLNNAATGDQDTKLSFRNQSLTTQVGLLGYETGLGLVLRNQTHGGTITLSVEDSSGNVETGLVITPDAGVALRFANSVTLETISGGAKTTGTHQITGDLDHEGSNVGFYNTTPTTKQTVSGSRGGNAALASLLTGLAAIGLITDSSSA